MPKLNNKGFSHILILIAALGLIAFVLVSSSADFKDKLFGSLFPNKPQSHAQQPIVFKDSSGNILPNNSSQNPITHSPTVKIELTSTLGPPVTTPPNTQTLTSCREITQSGNYILQSDLAAQSGQACINIHNANNVSLNCNGHTISGIIASSITPVIKIDNAPNFTISNCTVNNQESSPTQPHRRALIVSNSNGGTITHNTLNHNITVSSSNNLTVSNNTINGFYSEDNSSNNTIDNNHIHWHSIEDTGGGGGVSGVLSLGNNLGSGTNNRITNNTVDGNSNGVYRQTGADDGITTQNQTGITISGNTITNNWDCGIETFDLIQNSTISSNRITNSGYCGIGGWYSSSFIGNTVADNIIDDTDKMFEFQYLSSSHDSDTFPLGENVIYFKDNNFTNNQFINPRFPAPIRAFEVAYFDFVHLSQSMIDKLVLGNNRFTKNNFTTIRPGPTLLPGSMIIDGGANICNSTQVLPTQSSPINCHPSTTSAPPTPSPSPSSSPQPANTVSYKIAESANGLSSAQTIPYIIEPKVIDYTFQNSTPGQKFIWVEFIDSTGRTDRKSAQIELASTVTQQSASFILSTAGTNFNSGAIIPVRLSVNSDQDAVNLFSAKLTFPKDILEVQSIDTNSSFIAEGDWVERKFDNNLGTISIIGGIKNPGFQINGSTLFVNINFRAKQTGSGTINIEPSSEIFRNSDNTNIFSASDSRGVSLTIGPISSPTPSPTPLPSPSFTPSPSPSPSPPTATCDLISTSWISSSNPVTEGALVNLQVTASTGCNGKRVLFQVSKDNGLFPAEHASHSPPSVTLQTNATQANANIVASTSWVAEYKPNGPFGIFDPPQYYFEVNLEEDTTKTRSNDPKLRVNKTSQFVKGDGNEDGRISLVDLSVLLTNFNKTSEFPTELDTNDDGIINALDYSAMLEILRLYNIISPGNPSQVSCADGTNDQIYSTTSMVGCNGGVNYNNALTLCGRESHLCSVTEYLARGGQTTPSNSNNRWLGSMVDSSFTCSSGACTLSNSSCRIRTPGNTYPAVATNIEKSSFANSCSANSNQVGWFSAQVSTTLNGAMCCSN